MTIKFKNVPSWWYRQNVADRLVAGVLRPVATLYGAGAKWDFKRRDSYQSSLPVICVGNFTVGGAGKTPSVISLIHILQALGEKPVVLTRGYGGRVRGPYQVDPEKDKTKDVGDEPLLLSGHTPVVISANRAAGAQAIEQGEGTVIIMDDGFQNGSLKKDLSVVVVDGETGIGNGLVMPAGPLRSPLKFQIPKADILIINGSGAGGKAVTKLAKHHKIAVLQASLEMEPEQAAWLKGKKVVAFTGMARPAKFYATLEQCGADIVERVDFPDHHNFTHDEAARLLETASKTDETYLLTTQKDAVRLIGGKGALQWLRYEAEVVGVSLVTQPEGALANRVTEMLESFRAKHGQG